MSDSASVKSGLDGDMSVAGDLEEGGVGKVGNHGATPGDAFYLSVFPGCRHLSVFSEVVRVHYICATIAGAPRAALGAGKPVTSCVHSDMRASAKPETLTGCRTGTWTRRRQSGSTTSGC